MGVPGYLLSVFFAAQIVSLASWDDKTLLLRIGHQFGVDEDGGPRGAAVRCSGRGDILGGTKDIQGLRASENCSSLDIFSNLSIEPSWTIHFCWSFWPILKRVDPLKLGCYSKEEQQISSWRVLDVSPQKGETSSQFQKKNTSSNKKTGPFWGFEMVGPKVGSIYISIYVSIYLYIYISQCRDPVQQWRPPHAFRLQRASKMTRERSQWGFVGRRWPLPFRRNLGFGWVGFQLDRITKSGIEKLRKYYHIHPHPLSGGVIVRLKLPKSCSNGLFSTAILQPELKLHETSLCSALSSAALAEELHWNVSTVFLGWKATYDLQQCHFQAVVAIACHFADVGEGRGWKCPVDALTMGPGPGKWLKNGKISTKMGFWCQEHQDIS